MKHTEYRKKIDTHEDFMKHAVNSIGFDHGHKMKEIIDGAIDSNATHIELTYKKSTSSTKDSEVKLFKCKDNGDGFDNPMVGIIDELTSYGKKKTDPSKIGTYGIGTTTALREWLVQDGADVHIHSVDKKGRWADVISEVEDLDVYYDVVKDMFGQCSEKSGTEMTINGIDTSMRTATLIRDLEACYYPTYKNMANKGFNFTMSLNGEEIKFIDPLYSNVSDEDGVKKTWKKSVKVGNDTFEIIAVGLFPKFVKQNRHLMLSQFESTAGDTFRPMGSGLYPEWNGKFLQCGEGYFGTNKKGAIRKSGHNLNGLRICVRLTNSEGLNVNKSKWTIDFTTQRNKDLSKVISDITTEFERLYKSMSPDVTLTTMSLKVLQAEVNSKLGEVRKSWNGSYITLRESRKKKLSIQSPKFTHELVGEPDSDGIRHMILTMNKNHPYVEQRQKCGDNSYITYLVDTEMTIRTILGS